VAAEFNKKFNRNYGLFEAYRLEDAEVALWSVLHRRHDAVVVDKLRAQGLKVGPAQAARLPPLPGPELADALRHLKAVA
jgi:pyruvate ferredoxin oxidoreductase alpha subunit